MKNSSIQPKPSSLKARQTAVNRRIGVGLALLAVFVFVTFIIRQWISRSSP